MLTQSHFHSNSKKQQACLEQAIVYVKIEKLFCFINNY